MALIEMKEKGFPFNEVWFENKETKDEYSRLAGGVAWPVGGVPGWAVVLTVARQKDPILDQRIVTVFQEYSSQNVQDLLLRCNEYRKHLLVNEWYGDGSKASMMELLRRLEIPLYIRNAPFFDDPNALEYYVQIIRGMTRPSKKMLFFGTSKLPGHLIETPDQRMQLAKASEFPAVLALGYALSALIQYGPDHGQEERQLEQMMKELMILAF
jgi:hypothetical protein